MQFDAVLYRRAVPRVSRGDTGTIAPSTRTWTPVLQNALTN
jgi:hypothetical protein